MAKLFSEYTEAEFLALVQEIFDGAQKIEAQNTKDVLEFERVSGHRSGSDLIYYPVNDADLTPESLVDKVKTWRAENGIPGFKIA